MKRIVGITVLALATTFGMAQNDKTGAGFGVNAQGSQKITNGPVIESVSDHSAMIAWSTKKPAGTYIAYGTDQNNLSQKATAAWGGTNHRAEVKGLNPSTTYYFQVRSENAGNGGKGADVESPVASFTTVAKGAAPDKQNKNVGVNGSSSTAQNTMPQSDQGATGRVPLYRMYNGKDLHFYTTHADEASQAKAGGYQSEGVVGYLSSSQTADTTPLYRLYNSSNNDHYYTTNAAERDNATAQGYKFEEASGYVPTAAQSGTAPVYVLVAPDGKHFYTTDAQERERTKQAGYKDGGIAFYLWQR